MKLGKAISHTITIAPSANEGFIVSVGCGVFAFADKEALLSAMGEYLNDPLRWEGKYTMVIGMEEPQPEPVEETPGTTRGVATSR